MAEIKLPHEQQKHIDNFKKSFQPYVDDPAEKGCQARMLQHTCQAYAEAIWAEQNRKSEASHIMEGIISVCGNMVGPAAQNFVVEGHSQVEVADYILDRIREEVTKKLLNLPATPPTIITQ